MSSLKTQVSILLLRSKYALTKEVHYKVDSLTEEAKSALMEGKFEYTWGDYGGNAD